MSSIFACLCLFVKVTLLESLWQRGFNDLVGIGLTVLETIFQNGSINLPGNKNQEIWFLFFKNNAAKKFSHWLKISEDIEIKHVFQSRALFQVSYSLHTCCLRAFKFNSWSNFMTKISVLVVKAIHLLIVFQSALMAT